jgi:4-hydroxy-tetrahydrodipicolinate synthase
MPEAAPFTGLGVALLTVFDDSGAVDERTTADFARSLIDQGVRGVVVAGTTGEGATLDAAERARLLDAVQEAVGNDAAVIAGTGGATTEEAVGYTRDACAAGVDAVLALSPRARISASDPEAGLDAYCAGLGEYYAGVVEAAGDVPALAYHFPAVSPPGIPIDLLADLPTAGLKDSSGDPVRLARERELVPGALYVGSAHLLAEARAHGCTGAILGLANVAAPLCARALAGDAEAQQQVHPLEDVAAADFPAELKRQAAATHGFSPRVRRQ